MIHAGRVVLLLALLIGVTAAPAAADPEIGLSKGGSAWGPSLDLSLFDSDVQWVPGDVRRATFRVRNQSDEAAMLSLEILGEQINSLLETGDVTISARGGGGAWRETSASGTHQLVSAIDTQSGRSSRVDVIVAFASGSTNRSMHRSHDLRFRVRLTQSDVGIGNSDDHGLLPNTGGPTLWIVLIGLTLVAVGGSLTSTRREKEITHVHA